MSNTPRMTRARAAAVTAAVTAVQAARAAGVNAITLADAVGLTPKTDAQAVAGTKRVRDDGGAASAAEIEAATGGAASAAPHAKRSKDAEDEDEGEGNPFARYSAGSGLMPLAWILDKVIILHHDDDDDDCPYALMKAEAKLAHESVFCVDAILLVTATEEVGDGVVEVGVDRAADALRALSAFDATETFAHTGTRSTSFAHDLNAALAAIRILSDAVTSDATAMVSMGFHIFHQIVLGAVIRTMRAMQKRIATLSSPDVRARADCEVGAALAIDRQVHDDTYISAFDTVPPDNDIFFDQSTRAAIAFAENTVPAPARWREVLLYTPPALTALQNVGTSLVLGWLGTGGVSSAFVEVRDFGVYRSALAPTCRIAVHTAHNLTECIGLRDYIQSCPPRSTTNAEAHLRMQSIMMQVFIALEAADEHVNIFDSSLAPRFAHHGDAGVPAGAASILDNTCVHLVPPATMVYRRPGDKGLCSFANGGVRVTICAGDPQRCTISATPKAIPTSRVAPPTNARDLFDGFRELANTGGASDWKVGDFVVKQLDAMRLAMDSNPALAEACSIADLFLPSTFGPNSSFALACANNHEYDVAGVKFDGDAHRRPF